MPRIDRALLRSTGLSLSQYDVLLELHHADDQRLRMAELAERTVVSRSRVSRIVDELTARGLTGRESDAADGRVARVVITDRGREALRAAWPTYRSAIVTSVAEPLGDDAATVATALGRVLDAVDDLA